MKMLWSLFSIFFRIGLFTFGGGYAMLPMLEREIVQKRSWATRDDLLDYFAIGQATPGIIAVNTATMIGYLQKGVAGAASATLGMVSPSLIIIMAVASVLQQFAHIPAVGHAFAGIRVAVAALIAAAVIKMFRESVLHLPKKGEGRTAKTIFMNNGVPLLICVAAFVIVAVFGASPIYVVVGAAVAGLLLYGRRRAA